MSADRVVITGLGVVASNGVGVDRQWKAALAGQSGLGVLSREQAGDAPVTVGGTVTDFDLDELVPSKIAVQTDRWTWFCLAAAGQALDDAEPGPGPAPAPSAPYRTSVLTAAGSGGNAFGQRELQALWSSGPRAVSAYQSVAWFYAAAAGQISIHHGIQGRCGVTVADGAGGLAVAGQALRIVRAEPDRRVLLAGGEAPFSPYSMLCHQDRGDLSRSAAPERAYLPFRAAASGGVLGEGAAALVVESLDAARARGVPGAYAEIAAVVQTHDAPGGARSGAALAAAIRRALERAGERPVDVDVVFADGNGAPHRDAGEVAALRAVFGGRLDALPVAVPKSLTGHLGSGAAVLDLAWAAQALCHDVVPPAGVSGSPASLGVVEEPVLAARLRVALLVARGHGGFNAAAVLRLIGDRR